MALRKQNGTDNVLLQEGTVCSALLLQDEITICTGAPDALTLTGIAPRPHFQGVAATSCVALTLTGAAPTLAYSWTVFPGKEALALTGSAPTVQVDVSIEPALAAVTITGLSPDVQVDVSITPAVGAISYSGMSIARVNVAHSGTSITNLNAVTTRISHINACDYSGFQAKPHELIPGADGNMILREFWEDDHPIERSRRSESGKGPLRPESEPLDITTAYPSGVTVDDL